MKRDFFFFLKETKGEEKFGTKREKKKGKCLTNQEIGGLW